MVVENGGRVVLADVQREAVEALAKELGQQARFVVADVSSEESAKAAIRRRLSVSVDCMGWSMRGYRAGRKVIGRGRFIGWRSSSA